MTKLTLLDCTLRDGGYYTNWNFSKQLIEEYLNAMSAIGVDFVELGFRSSKNTSFKGPMAYTTDSYIETLNIPSNINIGVMVNASELCNQISINDTLTKLFPKNADESKVKLVRIACHFHEFIEVLPSSKWFKERGYQVGFNIMQASERNCEDFKLLAKEASSFPIDALYFADSLGSLNQDDIERIITCFRTHWNGPIGIHAHDNMKKAIQNTLFAIEHGVSWLDATITGMGRGPGNTQIEYLVTELCHKNGNQCNIVPLLELIENHFLPMQKKYDWGTNVYYYLAGIYRIHPTFIQNMLIDNRYRSEDILAAIEYLRLTENATSFDLNTLENTRSFYKSETAGNWNPKMLIEGKEVLIIGAGPSAKEHYQALESYIQRKKPLVIALNTESSVDPSLVNLRIASHPIRVLADYEYYTNFKKPLVLPYSMLPIEVSNLLKSEYVYDYGLKIENNRFEFHENYCVIPSPFVLAYALGIVTVGNARKIFLAGFDGYGADDPRTLEIKELFDLYKSEKDSIEISSVTPTRYNLPVVSIYAL